MPGQSFFGNGSGMSAPQTVDDAEILSFLNDEPLSPKEEPKVKEKQPNEKQKEGEKPQDVVKTGPLDNDEVFGEDDEQGKEGKKADSEDADEDEEIKSQNSPNSDEESVFSSLSKELYTLGIFTKEEGDDDVEINTPEEFASRWELESKRKAGRALDQFLSSKGSEYAEMFQSVFVDGVSPKTFLEKYSQISDISNMDVTDEGNQERLVREMYKTQGRKPEKIDSLVQKLKDYGDLKDEADEAKNFLIEKHSTDLETERQNKATEAQTKARIRQEWLKNVGEILTDKLRTRDFDGIPVNKQFAEEVGNYLTKGKYQGENGEPLTEFDYDILSLNDPKNHTLKVKMAMLLKIAKTDPTLSRITKKAISKESGGIFSTLKKNSIKTGEKKQEPEKRSFFS